MSLKRLPYYFYGKVISGFQRGGKQLGCPTANMDDDVVNGLPEELPCGVFYGLCRLEGGKIDKMVMSIGWNPQYMNERKTVEVHIIRKFDKDFYGSSLECVILGFIREMVKFNSLDELISAIKNDIDLAEKRLSDTDLTPIIEKFFSTHKPKSAL